MACAIIGVMLFHAPHNYIEYASQHFFTRFGRWGVELFLFVSGFGIYYSLTNNNNQTLFYIKRIIRIMPAAIIAGWLIYFIGSGKPDSLLGLNFWYIRTILIFYFFSPLLIRIVHARHSLTKIMAICAICYLLSVGTEYVFDSRIPRFFIFTVSWSLERLPAYLMGMWIASRGRTPEEEKNNATFLKPVGIMCLSAAIMLRTGYDYRIITSEHVLDIAYLLLGISTPFICQILCKVAEHLPVYLYRFMSWLGGITLELYVIHEFLYKQALLYLSESPRTAISIAIAFSILSAAILHVSINCVFKKLQNRAKY